MSGSAGVVRRSGLTLVVAALALGVAGAALGPAIAPSTWAAMTAVAVVLLAVGCTLLLRSVRHEQLLRRGLIGQATVQSFAQVGKAVAAREQGSVTVTYTMVLTVTVPGRPAAAVGRGVSPL